MRRLQSSELSWMHASSRVSVHENARPQWPACNKVVLFRLSHSLAILTVRKVCFGVPDDYNREGGDPQIWVQGEVDLRRRPWVHTDADLVFVWDSFTTMVAERLSQLLCVPGSLPPSVHGVADMSEVDKRTAMSASHALYQLSIQIHAGQFSV